MFFLAAIIALMFSGFGSGTEVPIMTPAPRALPPTPRYSDTAARQAALTIQRLYPQMSPDQQTGRVVVPVVQPAQQLMGLAPDGRIGPDTRARMADLGFPI